MHSSKNNKRGLRLIISGPPASGKGTQAEFIKKKYGLFHLSTGNILREAIKNGTPLGKEAAKYIHEGKLVPDDLIIEVVKDKLHKKDVVKRGFLLDGFPRSINQAKMMTGDISPDLIINLLVGDEVVTKRVTGRRIDSLTGKIYNIHFKALNPPNDPEVLKRLIHRKDDNLISVKKRLKTFRDNESLLEIFGERVKNVDAATKSETEVPLVTNKIYKIIDKYIEEQK